MSIREVVCKIIQRPIEDGLPRLVESAFLVWGDEKKSILPMPMALTLGMLVDITQILKRSTPVLVVDAEQLDNQAPESFEDIPPEAMLYILSEGTLFSSTSGEAALTSDLPQIQITPNISNHFGMLCHHTGE